MDINWSENFSAELEFHKNGHLVIDELPQQLDGGLRGHVVLVRHVDVVHENLQPGLPDFSRYNIPKREKYTKMTTKCTKWS
jgi:hypothetical protein